MGRSSAKTLSSLLTTLTMTKRPISDESLRCELGEKNWRALQQKIDLVQQHKYGQRPNLSTFVKNSFRQYVEMLAKADELENRAERTKANVMPSATTKKRSLTSSLSCSRTSNSRNLLRLRAEEAYECALETLEVLLECFPDLVNYLDRPVHFNCENCNVWPDIESVPRLINSRSPYNQLRPPGKSVRGLKIEAIRSQLELQGLGAIP